MKRKLIAIALCVAVAFSLAGCGGGFDFSDIDISSMRTENKSESLDSAIATNSTQKSTSNINNLMASSGSTAAESYEAYEVDGYYEAEPAMEFDSWYEEPDWNTAEYKHEKENGWQSPTSTPFSTFAADVDTASYANVRRMILNGEEVIPDAVRIEEMVNYFNYDYPEAKEGEPFSVTTEIAPCPWNKDTQLMLVGLKAKEIKEEEKTPSNLVLLIDVSGSMEGSDRLGLIQRAFRLLVDELTEDDRISVVTYASNDSVVLEGVHGDEKSVICEAIEDLFASGGTNGSDGINTAYELAEQNFIKGGNNRVILATDGDLNIGITDEGSLTRLIEDKAKSGIFLSVLGVGTDNYSDTNLEALADNGNGNYHYIDDISEARKVLVDEAGGTLNTVAKDVKLQMEFNPEIVKGYRLIGYENRTMAAEDFADDTKDGGEIGSGHEVTALYEIATTDSKYEVPTVESKYTSKKTDKDETEAETSEYEDEVGTLHIRYKEPDGDKSSLIDTIITKEDITNEMSDNMSWAAGVAQVGMILGDSEYAGTTDLDEVRDRLKKLTNEDDFREEFVYIIRKLKDR